MWIGQNGWLLITGTGSPDKQRPDVRLGLFSIVDGKFEILEGERICQTDAITYTDSNPGQ